MGAWQKCTQIDTVLTAWAGRDSNPRSLRRLVYSQVHLPLCHRPIGAVPNPVPLAQPSTCHKNLICTVVELPQDGATPTQGPLPNPQNTQDWLGSRFSPCVNRKGIRSPLTWTRRTSSHARPLECPPIDIFRKKNWPNPSPVYALHDTSYGFCLSSLI